MQGLGFIGGLQGRGFTSFSAGIGKLGITRCLLTPMKTLRSVPKTALGFRERVWEEGVPVGASVVQEAQARRNAWWPKAHHLVHICPRCPKQIKLKIENVWSENSPLEWTDFAILFERRGFHEREIRVAERAKNGCRKLRAKQRKVL